jgi:TfoX/Sxy family transcriptional regulator of competence genes
MATWTKSPQWLIELFDVCLGADPIIERRKMFGYPAAFVQGNMAAGLFQDSVVLRLPEEARVGLAPFQPMPGRSMGNYVLAPEDLFDDEEGLAALVGQAIAYTASLPPKEKKPRKARPKA